jgi:hypothetical protein
VPTQTPIQWVPEALSSGVKRLGREDDQSSASNAEVHNGGAITVLRSTFHGVVLNQLSTGKRFHLSLLLLITTIQGA